MNIELCEISVRELTIGYIDLGEDGVYAYRRRLNVRPAFQREFIYTEEQSCAVIESILNGYPLNSIYWLENFDETFELLDGQQRTISICQFCHGKYPLKWRGQSLFFNSLDRELKDKILNYNLKIYLCKGGTEEERIEWFKIVNIAGVQLTNQELLNAIYTSPWLTDAKKYFSKSDNVAKGYYANYLKGTAIRQDYLETALKWIATRNKEKVVDYMSRKVAEGAKNANELCVYFEEVLSWVRRIFPVYRKEMRGLDWGTFYNKYKTKNYDPDELERRILELLEDDDITRKQGIYEYLLGGNERVLGIQDFSVKMKRMAYEHQDHRCAHCKKYFAISELDSRRIVSWKNGGHTTADNCQLICKDCKGEKE